MTSQTLLILTVFFITFRCHNGRLETVKNLNYKRFYETVNDNIPDFCCSFKCSNKKIHVNSCHDFVMFLVVHLKKILVSTLKILQIIPALGMVQPNITFSTFMAMWSISIRIRSVVEIFSCIETFEFKLKLN